MGLHRVVTPTRMRSTVVARRVRIRGADLSSVVGSRSKVEGKEQVSSRGLKLSELSSETFQFRGSPLPGTISVHLRPVIECVRFCI